MSRVVHFEIHAGDPDRAIVSYGTVFGWKFDKYGGPVEYWLVTTGEEGAPGINGGLLRRSGGAPNATTPMGAFVCTIGVGDIDKTMAAIESAGGTLAHPKNAIPGVGWQAYFKDPEGNVFGVHQPDHNAK